MSRESVTADPGLPKRIADRCFRVRNMIYSAAINSHPKRVVVDIGSGRGQCVELIQAQIREADRAGRETVLFMVEPDPDSVRLLRRKLGRDAVVWDGGLLVKFITDAMLRRCGIYIIPATFARVWRDPLAMHMLNLRCTTFVSCFSLSYVFPWVDDLCTKGYEIMGCAYYYDAARPDGTLIDTHGIVMRMDWTTEKATVQFPGSETFEEHALNFGNLPFTNSTSVAQIYGSTLTRDETSVLRHLYVICSEAAEQNLTSRILQESS